MARAVGLTPRAVGPDGQAVNGNGGVVIDQAPTAGDFVANGTDLALRVAFGGGPSGSREPREPLPNPREFEDWLNMPDADLPGARRKTGDREPALAGR